MAKVWKKILWIGDAGCPSGFARATHEILDIVSQHYDVTVLGINYRGDPPIDEKTGLYYRYPMYSAMVNTIGRNADFFGVGRLLWMCHRVRPDAIVIQNDPWFIPYYINELRKRKPTGEYYFPEFAALPVITSLAVDGENFQGAWIKDVTLAVFWTNFALKEARKGGYTGPAKVIPLGVDLSTFYSVAKQGALERQKVVGLKDSFVVGNVNRNQPRKRWDLTIRYFAEWIKSRGVKDAWLFFHSAPTGDESVNLPQLAQYYGVLDRLAVIEPEPFYGKHDDDMRDTYNIFDVCVTTTQGEGMGLTTLEAMACGVPCIVPNWSALGDWAKGAAMMVPCTTTALQNSGLSVIGGVVDQRQFVEALDTIYRDKDRREMVRKLGLQRVQEPQFRWENIAKAWVATLDELFAQPEEPSGEIWQELNPAQQQGPLAGARNGPDAGLGKAPAGPERPVLGHPSQPERASEAAVVAGREAAQ